MDNTMSLGTGLHNNILYTTQQVIYKTLVRIK